MFCSIERVFTKGFLLKEEHVRKIHNIIKKRLQERNVSEDILFGVYRTDDLFFETASVDKLLEEENSRRNRIHKVEIKITSDILNFNLSFCRKKGVQINIKSKDRDFAFLIFSDLKEYLATEVLIFRFWGKNTEILRIFSLFLPLLLMTWLLTKILSFAPTHEEIQRVIASSDIHDKLNFLIEKKQLDSFGGTVKWTMYITIFLMLLFTMWRIISDKLSFLMCFNVFCFGKESERYEKYCSLKKQIIWGLIICGLLVGVFVNLICKWIDGLVQ